MARRFRASARSWPKEPAARSSGSTCRSGHSAGPTSLKIRHGVVDKNGIGGSIDTSSRCRYEGEVATGGFKDLTDSDVPSVYQSTLPLATF